MRSGITALGSGFTSHGIGIGIGTRNYGIGIKRHGIRDHKLATGSGSQATGSGIRSYGIGITSHGTRDQKPRYRDHKPRDRNQQCFLRDPGSVYHFCGIRDKICHALESRIRNLGKKMRSAMQKKNLVATLPIKKPQTQIYNESVKKKTGSTE